DPNDPQSVSATREAALHESARLTRVIDGLLALARGDGHRPERQPVDVASVIAQRHEAWRPLATEHRIDLRLDVPGEPLVTNIVPGHLDQILDNLIDNALDATSSGRAVVLRAGATTTAVEIHVTDDG